MARLHYVKKARKDNKAAGIKKGESYYWAGFRVGRSSFKKFWKERPPRSALTLSPFYSQVYDLEDRGFSGDTPEDLQGERDDMVSACNELADECEDSLSNMPDSLQYSPTGEMLQARIDGMQSTASEFENVDLDYDEPSDEEITVMIRDAITTHGTDPSVVVTSADIEKKRNELLAEWCEEKRQELSEVSFEYE